ncbi:hypothetical protein AB0J82_20885 [Asanoa sp. NPDC049518]|uniref:hypothetical protein n=1 Tax=unclassified Asanoa TaxID=2685164 RepID=UPI00343BC698
MGWFLAVIFFSAAALGMWLFANAIAQSLGWEDDLSCGRFDVRWIAWLGGSDGWRMVVCVIIDARRAHFVSSVGLIYAPRAKASAARMYRLRGRARNWFPQEHLVGTLGRDNPWLDE